METPPSLLRARELLARHTTHALPDLATVSSDRRSNPVYSALLEAAFLVAAADGQLAKEEVGELADLIAQMTSQAVSPGELADSIAAYSTQLERAGRAAMIDALAASCPDPEARRQVLGFAALVALCDRDLAPSELFVLHSLGKSFGLAPADVNAVVRALKTELGMDT